VRSHKEQLDTTNRAVPVVRICVYRATLVTNSMAGRAELPKGWQHVCTGVVRNGVTVLNARDGHAWQSRAPTVARVDRKEEHVKGQSTHATERRPLQQIVCSLVYRLEYKGCAQICTQGTTPAQQ
jgi:hypothetical protein